MEQPPITDVARWYAYSLAAVVGGLVVRQACLLFVAFVRAYGLFYLFKHVFYPALFERRNNGFDTVTRLHALIILTYIVANGILLGIRTHSAADLRSRASTLAMINMIPLFFGGRMNFWIDYLGIRLRTYYLMHRWVGRMVVLQGLLHTGLAISASSRWDRDRLSITGTIVRPCSFPFSAQLLVGSWHIDLGHRLLRR